MRSDNHIVLAGTDDPFVEVGPEYRAGGTSHGAADFAKTFEVIDPDGVHRAFSADDLDAFLKSKSRRGGGDDGIDAVTAAMLKEPESTFNL